MWLRLTLYNGDPIAINFDKVEAFGVANKDDANSYVNVADSCYHVKDTVSEIHSMIEAFEAIVEMTEVPRSTLEIRPGEWK